MNLLRFLARNAHSMMLLSAFAAILGGVCSAGLIATINRALHHTGPLTVALVGTFLAFGLGRLACTFASEVVLARFSQGAIARLRCELVRKILAVPLRHLENIGIPRIHVALTEDILNISQALLGVPITAVNIAILLGGAGYLGYLSINLLLSVAVMALLAGVAYRLSMASAYGLLDRARDEEDKLFRHFRSLTEGIKELKLHRARRRTFLNDGIDATTRAYQRYNLAAEIRFILSNNWSHLLFFLMIGGILFLMPLLTPVPPEAQSGYVLTTLYLMGPLAGLLSSFSLFGRAMVSLQHVEKIGVTLASQAQEGESEQAEEDEAPAFRQLELVGVTHSYHHEKDDSHFILGPMNLTFQPGELVFIVGGNGSGKSTLAKMITGLYPPESGEIRLDGEPITDRNRDDYRQLFSVVFSDFYLFDSLMGLENGNVDGKAQRYLNQLHLNHKVTIRDGQLSTTALSQGQRKRLALLTAYLEDRPFYLFDEWASDQDPQFKEIFYTQLLPELRNRGKTVVVITHDDRYFHHADRLVKLDFGQLVYDEPTGRVTGTDKVMAA